MLVSYKIANEKIDIEVLKQQLEGSDYVAMAFSEDRNMGDDLAFVCSPSWNSASGVKVFWNQRSHNSKFLEDNGNIAQNPSINHTNGLITCAFSLGKLITIQMPSESREFDLEREHYLLLATGAVEGTGITHHNARIASKDKFGKLSGKKTILELSLSEMIKHNVYYRPIF